MHLVLELDILGVKDWIETHILEGQDFTYEATPRRSLARGWIVWDNLGEKDWIETHIRMELDIL